MGACDPGWMDASFQNMGCLFFENTAMNFEAAIQFCGESNAHLVEVQTEAQMDFLVMELQSLETLIGQYNWWGGASDSGREGHWYWQHSLTDVGTFVWGYNQPDFTYASNYLAFGYGGETTYHGWDNSPDMLHNPICQILLRE